MTLQEEINNLTWHNAINKLKSILRKLTSMTWGGIGGNIEDQEDLVNYINENSGDFVPISGTTAGNPITGDLEINSKEGEEKALILSKKGVVGITKNPKFSFGRIVNGGINEPKLRIIFSDDEEYTDEVTCFEVEPSGTAASVRSVIGTHYEAFLEQEEKPLFRIASFLKDGNKSTRMEFGSGGNNETDIFLERWASWAFALVMGGSPKVIFYPDSILRQPGVVDAFQQTPIGQVVATPNPDVKKLFYREGKGLVELGGDGIEKPLVNNNSYSTTETLTGGTWIDGKPIYRKTYQGVQAAAGGLNVLMDEILGSEFPLETLINIYGQISDEEDSFPLNYIISSDSSALTTQGLVIVSGTLCNASIIEKTFYLEYFITSENDPPTMILKENLPFNYIVILEYTKTTD